MPTLQALILLSEVVAALVVWQVWRGSDPTILKVLVTIMALIPFIGPLCAMWVSSFPEPLHRSLQDKRKGADVYWRWAHVLRLTDPQKRFKAWQDVRNASEE